jgi:hypothetical protein
VNAAESNPGHLRGKHAVSLTAQLSTTPPQSGYARSKRRAASPPPSGRRGMHDCQRVTTKGGKEGRWKKIEKDTLSGGGEKGQAETKRLCVYPINLVPALAGRCRLSHFPGKWKKWDFLGIYGIPGIRFHCINSLKRHKT